VSGLTYILTDKRPQWQWLKTIGKTEDPSCVCDGWTPAERGLVYKVTEGGGEDGGIFFFLKNH